MRRSITSLLLAALIVLPTGASTLAGEPTPSEASAGEVETAPPSEPTSEPSPATDDPTASDDQDPNPPAEPTPTTDPGIDPVPADPTDPATDPATDPSTADPATDPASPATDADGRPDATGRYIVILEGDADLAAVEATHRQREGTKKIRKFSRAINGFSARLSPGQRRALLADPRVTAVVPDEVIELTAQVTPNGISRVGGKSNPIAKINGVDERVDADVAIVDTGIYRHPDLNVAGGYNCSTSDRSLWRDRQGHGTHVAGTVGAIDNTSGVVGVAPGVRLWAVRILNDEGYGLLSWYVCGLDWILAQRDPDDASQPLIESVNMSVAKSGSDDGACGTKNKDVLHKAICRVVDGGITVVAAAANDSGSATKRVPAAYNEVITVSALADTDGKSGGLGGNSCYSWGTYDKDDTFANFSNYGYDVDLIAPGKCIWSTTLGPSYGYSSGTSMAAPHVTGAAALYKASRPDATPAEVKESLQYLGNLNWKTSTDPDSHHEKLLGVTKLANLGSFSFASPDSAGPVGESGGTTTVAVRISRSSTFFERVRFYVTDVPSGWSASLASASLLGWTANSTNLQVTVPPTTPEGTYHVRVQGTNWGRSDTVSIPVVVQNDNPTVGAPSVKPLNGATVSIQSGGVPSAWAMRVSWPAGSDATSDIVGYEVQHSTNGGSWGGTKSTSSLAVDWSGLDLTASHSFRVRARDEADNWSSWAPLATAAVFTNIGDRNSAIDYSASWSRVDSSSSTNGTRTSSAKAGATARYTFTGRGIAVIAPRSPNRGKISVYIDGALKSTVDTKASSYQPRRVIYSTTWSSSGTHQITLKVAGTSGRPTVSLDGFVILR